MYEEFPRDMIALHKFVKDIIGEPVQIDIELSSEDFSPESATDYVMLSVTCEVSISTKDHGVQVMYDSAKITLPEIMEKIRTDGIPMLLQSMKAETSCH